MKAMAQKLAHIVVKDLAQVWSDLLSHFRHAGNIPASFCC